MSIFNIGGFFNTMGTGVTNIGETVQKYIFPKAAQLTLDAVQGVKTSAVATDILKASTQMAYGQTVDKAKDVVEWGKGFQKIAIIAMAIIIVGYIALKGRD